ncbi:MAG: GAF domain-containing protein, partial [Deltaproteobacteria bacterium]|nr:GAF domain-containing protein [Deltaproteobacteria bacterium]
MAEISALKTPNSNAANEEQLKTEVEYRTNLQEICNKIYAAANLDEILIDLKDEITRLFDAERITVFVVDGKQRELVSRFKSGAEIAEIRIPVAPTSLAGYAASKQKILNIKNVYDDNELNAIDEDLKFDKSWDQKTGFRTEQVLVFPIIFKKFMLGVIQLLNRLDNTSFTKRDEWAVEELSKILGIALYNQKRMAKTRINKFTYLVENHLVTQKELDKAIGDARQKREPIESVLI